MRIAYFINQYPKVSHSFIRREILALERQGIEVQRIALRGWEGDLVDEEDLRERSKTRFVLKDGLRLLFYLIKTVCAHPVCLFSALRMAWRLGCKADRSLPYHLVYLIEACQVFWWTKAYGAEHIHAHFGSNSAEVVMLTHALGGPTYSFTVHGPEEFDKPQLLKLSDKIQNAAFVVAISSYGRSQLFRWISHDHWHKIRIVHCGIEQAFYDVLPMDMPDTGRLICVGRLCEQKGQLLLLEACRELKARGISFEMVLAGDGEMRSEIETLIERYDLQQEVSITGWISSDEVRARLLDSRGLVLPSFAEGLPVVIMEAMALRRPVISTYVAGIPELVIPGKNGWLVPAGAVMELADAMEGLLQTPTDELQQMGDAAYVRVRQRHDVDTEAAKLAALFKEQMG